ncbi:MAG: Zinc finger Ran-binding domain-containing protein 2 [Marteilia pararefringens]
MKQQNTRSHYNDQVGQQYAQKSNGIFSPQDWKCSHCDNVNFAFRTTCNLCKKPLQDVRQKSNVRTKDVSERKGRGGGYLELDVEYVEKNKNLSDDEFDDVRIPKWYCNFLFSNSRLANWNNNSNISDYGKNSIYIYIHSKFHAEKYLHLGLDWPQ